MSTPRTCDNGHPPTSDADATRQRGGCSLCELPASADLLRSQAAFLPLILENMGDGLIVADELGQLILFNPAAERMLGYGITDAPQSDWPRYYGIFDPHTKAPYPAHDLPLACALRGEEVSQVELYIRNANVPAGTYISVTARPMRDGDGNIRGGVAVLRDVTVSKNHSKAVNDLEASERRFRDLFTRSPDGIFVEKYDGTILDVNPAGCRLQNMERDELLGQNVRDLVPPSERERVVQGLEKMVRGEREHVERFAWPRGGPAIPVELMSSRIEYDGTPALLLHIRDIRVRPSAAEDRMACTSCRACPSTRSPTPSSSRISKG